MNRLQSIDFVRGFVMIVMALDHVRDLMHVDALTQNPTDLATTTPALFFTRWITHLCAPTFVFLSGVSVYLALKNQGDRAAQQQFLLKRGLWLIALEFTLINFGIWFDPLFRVLLSQVIAAIGFGFIALSGLLHFTPKISARFKISESYTIGFLGLIIIFGHNLLSGFAPAEGSILQVVWSVLFSLCFYQITPGHAFFINYPLLPWLGIMLAGFGFGAVFYLPEEKRKKALLQIGLASLALFALLRTFNFYGDPAHWSFQKDGVYSLLSFFNTTKYPPALLYVLMTLGISLLLLFAADGRKNKFIDAVSLYGKVPLFYYLVHWYLIHTVMIGLMLAQGYSWAELNFGPFGFGRPGQGGGVGLGGIYLIWAGVVLSLYPVCRWYGGYKTRNRENVWLRYL